MASQRLTRVNELLRREIGGQLYRVLNDDEVNMAALTVTHVDTSPDLRHARVFVSVLDDSSLKQRQTISLLNRHKGEIQKAVSAHVVLKYTPRLRFLLDHGIEQGEIVLNILEDLEETNPDAFDDPLPPGEPIED